MAQFFSFMSFQFKRFFQVFSYKRLPVSPIKFQINSYFFYEVIYYFSFVFLIIDFLPPDFGQFCNSKPPGTKLCIIAIKDLTFKI